MKTQKGFTLIELLVVIAIIGVLASVVLAATNSARNKGADAAIKGNLSGVRTNANTYYDTNDHYGAVVQTTSCSTGLFADPNIALAITQAGTASGATGTCLSDASDGTSANADSWAVSMPLKTDPLTSWCVDSAGKAINGTASISSNVASCS